jgi:hypothetical protein
VGVLREAADHLASRHRWLRQAGYAAICIGWLGAALLASSPRALSEGLSAPEVTSTEFTSPELAKPEPLSPELSKPDLLSPQPLNQPPAREAAPRSPPVLIIGGAKPPAQRCDDGSVRQSSQDCLNQKLRPDNAPPLPRAPIDARSPDIQTGLVNIPAVKQQYGRNFGVSAHPYRPPPLTYSNPLRGR